MLKLVLLISILGAGYYIWDQHTASIELAALVSPAGFVPAMMPIGTKPGSVLIMAPKNCPSEAAQRAKLIAIKLDELGIPYKMSSSARLQAASMDDETRKAMQRSDTILRGEIPAVFINGMGKANPSIKEVIDEYHRSK